MKLILWLDPNIQLWPEIRAFAASIGATVVCASNASQAQNLVEEYSAQGLPFDLVVADIRLPDACGLDFLRKIRASEPRAKVAVCSGYESETGVLVENGGFLDAWWTKPLKVDEFLEELRRVLGVGP